MRKIALILGLCAAFCCTDNTMASEPSTSSNKQVQTSQNIGTWEDTFDNTQVTLVYDNGTALIGLYSFTVTYYGTRMRSIEYHYKGKPSVFDTVTQKHGEIKQENASEDVIEIFKAKFHSQIKNLADVVVTLKK